MPFVPMYRANGVGSKCSISPLSERDGGGWYCLTCDKTFPKRESPPCGEVALPNEKYDKKEGI